MSVKSRLAKLQAGAAKLPKPIDEDAEKFKCVWSIMPGYMLGIMCDAQKAAVVERFQVEEKEAWRYRVPYDEVDLPGAIFPAFQLLALVVFGLTLPQVKEFAAAVDKARSDAWCNIGIPDYSKGWPSDEIDKIGWVPWYPPFPLEPFKLTDDTRAALESGYAKLNLAERFGKVPRRATEEAGHCS